MIISTTRSPQVYEFGEFRIDSCELTRGETVVSLEATPHAVLFYLVTSSPRVVSRNELLDNVWGEDVHVSMGTVDVAISRVRRALGESARRPRHIKTVQRRGWKFVGGVRASIGPLGRLAD